MTENMKKFLALADGNSELSEKLKKGLSEEEMTALAKEHGIELTEEDFKTNGKKLLSTDGATLSDEELDKVAGGLGKGFEDQKFYLDIYCYFCAINRKYTKKIFYNLEGNRLDEVLREPCDHCGKSSWIIYTLKANGL